jgi:hypothetical protein
MEKKSSEIAFSPLPLSPSDSVPDFPLSPTASLQTSRYAIKMLCFIIVII